MGSMLTVDELGDQDAILVQIESAQIKSFNSDYLAGGNEKVVLTFSEFPGLEYPLNATSFRALADRYTNDKANGFRAWVNKPCVLVRVETENPQAGNEKVISVWVAKPDVWNDVVRELHKQEAAEKPAVDPSAKKKVGRAAKKAAK